MADDNWDNLFLDERCDLGEQLAVLEFIRVEAPHKFLPRTDDDFARNGNSAQPIDGSRIEFQGALIFEFLQNVLLHLFNRSLRVDEVIVENFLEGLERLPRLLLEHAVTSARERLIVIGRTIFAEFSDAGTNHFFIVPPRLPPALELACDRLLLIDEQHHNVNRRLPEMNAERSVVKLAPQRVHLVDEEFQTLDLHLRPREAVEDYT